MKNSTILALLMIEKDLIKDDSSVSHYECRDCGHTAVSMMGDTDPRHCLNCGSKNLKKVKGEKSPAEVQAAIKKFPRLSSNRTCTIKCATCEVITTLSAKDAWQRSKDGKSANIHCGNCGENLHYNVNALSSLFGDLPQPRREKGIRREKGDPERPEDRDRFPDPDEIVGSVSIEAVSCADKDAEFHIEKQGKRLLAFAGDLCIGEREAKQGENAEMVENTLRTWAEENKGASLADAMKARKFNLSKLSVGYDSVVASAVDDETKVIKAKFKDKQKTISKDLKQALSISMVGINRGVLSTENPLVQSLVDKLVEAGAETDEVREIITKAFEESVDSYSELIHDKTVELMDMSPKVRNEYANSLTKMRHTNVAFIEPRVRKRDRRAGLFSQLENPIEPGDDDTDTLGASVTRRRRESRRGSVRQLAAKSSLFNPAVRGQS